jgi:hypothetical protein
MPECHLVWPGSAVAGRAGLARIIKRKLKKIRDRRT